MSCKLFHFLQGRKPFTIHQILTCKACSTVEIHYRLNFVSCCQIIDRIAVLTLLTIGKEEGYNSRSLVDPSFNNQV